LQQRSLKNYNSNRTKVIMRTHSFWNIILFFGTTMLYGMEQQTTHQLVTVHLKDGESRIPKDLLVQNSGTIQSMVDDFPEKPLTDIELNFTSKQFNAWYTYLQKVLIQSEHMPRKLKKFQRSNCYKEREEKKENNSLSIDNLINIATVSNYLDSELPFKKSIKILKDKLKNQAICNKLITKLKENPGYLHHNLATILRKKILACNKQLLCNHIQKLLKPDFKIHTSFDKELLVTYCPHPFGSTTNKRCLMFYNTQTNNIRLWDSKTRTNLGNIEPQCGKSFSSIDFNYSTQQFACATNSKIYIADLQNHFKGLIQDELNQKTYFLDSTNTGNTPFIDLTIDEKLGNLIDSKVRWHPTNPWLALVQSFSKSYWGGSDESTVVTIFDCEKKNHISWKSDGWLQGLLAWSQDGKYLAIPKGDSLNKGLLQFGSIVSWLEVYDVSTLMWNTKTTPQKTFVPLGATAAHGFTIDQKQFLVVACPDHYRHNLDIFLLHMAHDKFYFTPFCKIPSSSSTISSIAIGGDNNQTLVVHTGKNEIYQVDLTVVDTLYLEYINKLHALPLKDILLLKNNPNNKEAMATIQTLENEYALKKSEKNKSTFINRFLFGKIGYGIPGLTGSCIIGCLLYQAIKKIL